MRRTKFGYLLGGEFLLNKEFLKHGLLQSLFAHETRKFSGHLLASLFLHWSGNRA